MSRSPSRTIASAALLAAIAATPLSAQVRWPWRPKIDTGATVRFSGAVSGPDGAPLAGIGVAVEAWKSSIDIRALERVRTNRTRAVATTGERGDFALDWTWDPAHRKFAVVAFVPYRGAEGDTEHELVRLDVTSRLRDGGPVTVAISVPPPGVAFVERLRAFEAALATDDERRTYRELGLPERVDRTPMRTFVETAWWYFARGKVCRFRDGVRAELQSFTPVRPEEGGAP